MKTVPLILRWSALLLMTITQSGWSQGAILWDGPDMTFSQPAGVGSSVQDQLTPGVSLTRGTTQGLFNAATEAAYTHFVSPQDTAWAYGSLADYSSLGYTDWEHWNGSHPPTMVGQPAVVHLISENIYLSLTFTSWGGNGGGFSYIRSTPGSVPEPSVGVLGGLSAGLVFLGCHRKATKANGR